MREHFLLLIPAKIEDRLAQLCGTSSLLLSSKVKEWNLFCCVENVFLLLKERFFSICLDGESVPTSERTVSDSFMFEVMTDVNDNALKHTTKIYNETVIFHSLMLKR